MTEDEQNTFVKLILFSIDNKIALTNREYSRLIHSPKFVEDTKILNVTCTGFVKREVIFKLKERYFSIMYEELIEGNKWGTIDILELNEVKPIEDQVTVTRYIPIDN